MLVIISFFIFLSSCINVENKSESVDKLTEVDVKNLSLGNVCIIGDSNIDKEVYGENSKFFYEFFDDSVAKSVTNLSKKGGGLLSGYYDEEKNEWTVPTDYINIEFMPDDTDTLLLYASFNDVYGQYKLGDPSDIVPNTVYGSLNFLLQRAYYKNPNMNVVIIAPVKWPKLEKDNYMKECCRKYVDVLERFSKTNGLLFLNLYDDSLENLDDQKYNKDGIHINIEVHKDYLYEKILSFLKDNAQSLIHEYNLKDYDRRNVLENYYGSDIHEKYPYLAIDLIDNEQHYKSIGRNAESNIIYGKNMFMFHYLPENFKLIAKQKYIDDELHRDIRSKFKVLQNIIESKGKELYVIIPPCKESLYYEYLPDENNVWVEGKDNMELIVSDLRKSIGLNIIYPLDLLTEAKKYARVFALDDMHWNQIGGYIATQALYDIMGLKRMPLSKQYIFRLNDNNLYVYDIIYNNGKDILSENYEGEYSLSTEIKYTSNGDVDKNIVIIGDSFRYWISNIMRKDFKECSILHRGHINSDPIFKDVKDADVMLLQFIPSAYNTLPDLLNMLIRVESQ